MPHSDTRESQKLAIGLIMVGAALFIAAAACAVAAAEHMAVAAAFCGPVARHCILCVASAGSLLASAGVIAAGVMLLGDRSSLQQARQHGSPRRRAAAQIDTRTIFASGRIDLKQKWSSIILERNLSRAGLRPTQPISL